MYDTYVMAGHSEPGRRVMCNLLVRLVRMCLNMGTSVELEERKRAKGSSWMVHSLHVVDGE